MPKLNRTYRGVRFVPQTIRAAVAEYTRIAEAAFMVDAASGPFSSDAIAAGASDSYVRIVDMVVDRGSDTWTFDSEDEFFAELRAGYGEAHLRTLIGEYGKPHFEFTMYLYPSYVSTTVETPTRSDIVRVIAILDEAVESSRLPAPAVAPTPPPPKPRIFIGHGGVSSDWLVLQNDLQNVHGYDVESFESGERAGHSIRDILTNFLDHNSFAILVLSQADEQVDNTFRARQNVVHEAGLFQGRLGFDKAIILVERGTELFSNLDGIQHISYSTGDIAGATGRIIAVLRREFPNA